MRSMSWWLRSRQQVVSHLPGGDGGQAAEFGGELAQVTVVGAPFSTSDAQATPDTLPCQAFGPGRQASGGTRSHGPAEAASRS
jgi:hypothetical protein